MLNATNTFIKIEFNGQDILKHTGYDTRARNFKKLLRRHVTRLPNSIFLNKN